MLHTLMVPTQNYSSFLLWTILLCRTTVEHNHLPKMPTNDETKNWKTQISLLYWFSCCETFLWSFTRHTHQLWCFWASSHILLASVIWSGGVGLLPLLLMLLDRPPLHRPLWFSLLDLQFGVWMHITRTGSVTQDKAVLPFSSGYWNWKLNFCTCKTKKI